MHIYIMWALQLMHDNLLKSHNLCWLLNSCQTTKNIIKKIILLGFFCDQFAVLCRRYVKAIVTKMEYRHFTIIYTDVHNIYQLLHCIGFYSRVFVLFLFWRGVSRVKIKTKQIRVNKIQIQCNNGFIIYLCHSSW